MGILPESLIGLDRIVSLGQIGPLARMRGPRPAGERADTARYAWERVANVLRSQDPPNQRLNALDVRGIWLPGSATGSLGANSASRVDSRSAMDTLAAGS